MLDVRVVLLLRVQELSGLEKVIRSLREVEWEYWRGFFGKSV